MAGFAAQGPYGPNNPPPPPKGPLPGKAGGKRSRGESDKFPPPPLTQDSALAESPGHAFLHRKLNSRQRKKFREAQGELHEGRRRERSRSPVPRERQRSQFNYRERSTVRHEDERAGPDSKLPPRSARKTHRMILQDARQYTPDQIFDETYGRLSPPTASQGQSQYQRDQTDLQWTKRTDWPDEMSNPSRRGPETYRPESMTPQVETSLPAWHGGVRGRSDTTRPEVHQQTYGIEDEVDWDDGEAFNMPVPARAYELSNTNDFKSQRRAYEDIASKPQQPTYQGGSRYASAQVPDRSTTSTWEQPDWRKATRKENEEWSQPQQNWAAKTEPQKPKVPFDKRKKGRTGMGAPQPQYEPINRRDQAGAWNSSFPESSASSSAPHAPISVPETVYDLRKYDTYITKLHKSLHKSRAYRNGNGKAAPHHYGSMQTHDLGLCFVTFCTDGWCEMGVQCAWRHHPLTKTEREWITQLGKPRSKEFLEQLPRRWAIPEVPLPGANMAEKAHM